MKSPYCWVIAGCALVVLWVTNGLIIPGITAFDPSLLDEFGWSRGTLKFRDLITFALAGLLGPLAGALADRYGVRRFMIIGAALLAVCLVLYGRIQSATHMYLIHTLFAVVLASCGLIVAIMLVSNWFVRHRGTAIGIALVGTSLGGMFFPPFATWLIGEYGWRQAFTWEAAFPLGLLVVLFALVRNRPHDMGLVPYGEKPAAESSAGAPDGAAQTVDTGPPELPGLEFKAALKTGTFWALAFAAMTTFFSILGFQANLFLHLTDLGLTPERSAFGLTLLFGLALIGKFLFGFLADHVHQKGVFLANIAVMLTGAVLLATMELSLLWVAIVLFGLGWGGLYTMIQLLTVDSLGLKAAGKILGTITTFDAIGGGLGIWLTGSIYDWTGSYQAAFTLVAVLIFLALLAATQVKKHVPPAGAG
ncbi:MAG: MFS transporter [bacterium]|nr:MFS transporter [bacterium]